MYWKITEYHEECDEIPYTEIYPGLWIGNRIASIDLDFIKNKEIKCIINCTYDLPFILSDDTIENIRVSVRDDLSKNEINNLYISMNMIVNKIFKQLNKNKSVLVHCKAGRQRSASIVAAYLIKFANLDVEESIKFIQSKRLISFQPKPNFIKALQKFKSSLDSMM